MEQNNIKTFFENRVTNLDDKFSDFFIGGQSTGLKTEKEYNDILRELQKERGRNHSLIQNYELDTETDKEPRLRVKNKEWILPRVTELFDLITAHHDGHPSVRKTWEALKKSKWRITEDLVQQYCDVCPECCTKRWNNDHLFAGFRLLLRSTRMTDDDNKETKKFVDETLRSTRMTDDDNKETKKFLDETTTLRMMKGETEQGIIKKFDKKKRKYEVIYGINGSETTTEHLSHDELTVGVSASLKEIVQEQEIEWSVNPKKKMKKNNEVVEIFSFSGATYQSNEHDCGVEERYHKLDDNDDNSAYTDGCRLQCYTDEWICRKFEYVKTQIEYQLRIFTNQPNYELRNCVILNTTTTQCIRQQLHTDWERSKKKKGTGKQKDCKTTEEKPLQKYFILIAIDEGQNINVKVNPSNDDQEYAVMKLKKDHVYIGSRNCIHGGSSNKGLRFHAMFVPKGESSAEKSETDFYDDDNLIL